MLKFFWLNLIDRKNNALVIQKIISIWIKENDKYKKIIWDSTVLSKRIISLPMSAYLSIKEQNYILKSFELFINNC